MCGAIQVALSSSRLSDADVTVNVYSKYANRGARANTGAAELASNVRLAHGDTGHGNDVEAGKGVIAGVPMLLFTRIQWEFLGRSLKYRLHQLAGALVQKPSPVSQRGESSTLISLLD